MLNGVSMSWLAQHLKAEAEQPGMPIKRVAAELGISVSSINTYRHRIFRMTGMTSNAALIRYAMKSGPVI